MTDVVKFMNIDIDSIQKIYGIDKANLSKIYGFNIPTGQSWANWTETSESSLVDGSDGSNIWVFICDGGLGANETAQTGTSLTGADLVATQNGNIAGHVANWRSLDGANDFFALTQTAIDTLIANVNKTWTLLFHIDNWTGGNTDFVTFIRNADSTDILHIGQGVVVPGKFEGRVKQDGVDGYASTANNFPGGDVWVGMWADGVNNMRAGFIAAGAGSGAGGQPIKWSDFAAGDRDEANVLKGDFSGEAFNGSREIGAYSGIAKYAPFDLKTVVIANTCLIDNSS